MLRVHVADEGHPGPYFRFSVTTSSPALTSRGWMASMPHSIRSSKTAEALPQLW